VPPLTPPEPDHAHFCQAGVEHTLSPITFVQALSEALATRYAAFRASLIKAGSRQIVINTTQQFETVAPGAQVIGTQIGKIVIDIKGGDARSVFDDAVARPIRELGAALAALASASSSWWDSLDEALGFGADNNLVQLLGIASDFPPQVRFILTSRFEQRARVRPGGAVALDLIANAPLNMGRGDAVRDGPARRAPQPDRITAAVRIAAKSEGNFLYAHHVVEDLLSRGDSISDADTLESCRTPWKACTASTSSASLAPIARGGTTSTDPSWD
jgi:hypothetical protein